MFVYFRPATFAAFFRPVSTPGRVENLRGFKSAALDSVCKQLLENNTEPPDLARLPPLHPSIGRINLDMNPAQPFPENKAPHGPPNVVYCGQTHPLGIMISQTQKQHSSSWQPALHCSSDPSRWPNSEHPRVRKVGEQHRHDASQTASRATRADHKLTHLSVLHIHLGKRHNLPRIT